MEALFALLGLTAGAIILVLNIFLPVLNSPFLPLGLMIAGVAAFVFVLTKFVGDERPAYAIGYDLVVYFSKIPLAFMSIVGGAYLILSTRDLGKLAIFFCIVIAIDLSVKMLVQKQVSIGIGNAFLFALKWFATAFSVLIIVASLSIAAGWGVR